MADYLLVGPVADLETSARHVVTLRSWRDPSQHAQVLLFRFEGESAATWYAMEAECPHMGAALEHADLEDSEDVEDLGSDKVIVCPWHMMDFSLSTGASSSGLKACTYGVQVRDGQVHLEPPGSAGDDWRVLSCRAVSERFAEPAPTSSSSPAPTFDLTNPPKTLRSFCRLILLTSDPTEKVAHTRTLVNLFRTGKLTRITSADDLPMPDVPPRENFQIVDGSQVAKRGKGGSVASRAKLLSALAWIELWAIDLAIDVIGRFAQWKVGSEDGKTGTKLPLWIFSDFLKVAEDEAKHFTILRERIEQLGFRFGEFPVHNGLWESARETTHSLFARIAVVNLVHEARGMDVNPMQIKRCSAAGDQASADVLTIIHHDEVTHVATGHRAFQYLCQNAGVDPIQKFRTEVASNFYGKVKGPFNVEDRERAGLTREWFEGLEGQAGSSASRGTTAPVSTATATQAPPTQVPDALQPLEVGIHALAVR